MTAGKQKIGALGSDQDDDPTAELEALSDPAGQDDKDYEIAASEANLGAGNDSVSALKSELQSRGKIIQRLQCETEQLRSRRNGLESEIKVLDDVVTNLTEELQLVRKKHADASESLEKRDREIETLRSQLSDREKGLQAARQSRAQHNGATRAGPGRTALGIADNSDNVKERFDSKSPAAGQRPATNGQQRDLALLVPLGGEALKQHSIRAGRLSIGSSPDNDIQIKSTFISRHHAEIVSNWRDSILRDLDSTNGTYVNSNRIKRHALRHGDSITIGKHHFRFVSQNPGGSK